MPVPGGGSGRVPGRSCATLTRNEALGIHLAESLPPRHSTPTDVSRQRSRIWPARVSRDRAPFATLIGAANLQYTRVHHVYPYCTR